MNLILVLLSAGVLTILRDLFKFAWRRFHASAPEAREQEKVHEGVRQAQESILVVSLSRDQLVADNRLLREQRAEVEQRYLEERRAWLQERTELRGEIEEMERRLRSALDDLSKLRARHGFSEETRPTA